MKLTNHEIKKLEDRCFNHYHSMKYPSLVSWGEYWKVNKKNVFACGRMFKKLLSESGFTRYLQEHELNPWTIYNIENLNG